MAKLSRGLKEADFAFAYHIGTDASESHRGSDMPAIIFFWDPFH